MGRVVALSPDYTSGDKLLRPRRSINIKTQLSPARIGEVLSPLATRLFPQPIHFNSRRRNYTIQLNIDRLPLEVRYSRTEFLCPAEACTNGCMTRD